MSTNLLQQSVLLDHALAYARHGWPVLPLHTPTKAGCSCHDPKCDSIGKHPRTMHGVHDATTEEEPIRKWWRMWPDANVGIACGVVLAIDVDGEEGQATIAALEQEHGPLPKTPRAFSGRPGGIHLVFQGVPGVGNKVKFAPSLDTRSAGGYIVAAPSLHANGRLYQWDDDAQFEDLEPAEPPGWLLALMQPKGGKGQAASSVADVIPAGKRNHTLASLGGTMRRPGMAEEEIAAALLTVNTRRCKPPLPEEEVRKIAASVARYAPAAPYANGGAPPLSDLDAPLEYRRPPEANGATPDAATVLKEGYGIVPVPRIEDAPSGVPASSALDREGRWRFPLHNTDWGNARRLISRHGSTLRYTEALGWLAWTGAQWRIDMTGTIDRRAKDTIGVMYEEAGRESGETRQALVKWALQSESAGRIGAMIDLAKTEPGICMLADEFDANPWLLNCRNGTIDLKTATLLSHRSEDLITKLVPVAYDPAALCLRWDLFLREVTQGDSSLVAYLRRAFGYSLTGDIREQNLFFLYGLGSNGKTTLQTVLSAVLGDYATTAAPGLLLENKHDQHPTAIADLHGRRLVLCSEVGEGKRMAEELVKRMTGGERLKGRRMHRDFFEFPPTHKLWLAANHKPTIRGTDYAIWRRIHTVPFTTTFYNPDRATDGQPVKDPLLLGKLMDELPGILAWAVRGCIEWQTLGLAPPQSVLDATESYREEMDTLGSFLADHCIEQPGTSAKSSELYATYQTWCGASGERQATQTAFGKALTERGFSRRLDRYRGRVWDGIGLLTETADRGLNLPEA